MNDLLLLLIILKIKFIFSAELLCQNHNHRIAKENRDILQTDHRRERRNNVRL